MVANEDLAVLFGINSKGGMLELVFLNGCHSETLGYLYCLLFTVHCVHGLCFTLRLGVLYAS